MRLLEVYDWQVRDEARKAKRAELRRTRDSREPQLSTEFKRLLMKLTSVVPWKFKKRKSFWGTWGQVVLYKAQSDKPKPNNFIPDYVAVELDTRKDPQLTVMARVDQQPELKSSIENSIDDLALGDKVDLTLHHDAP